MEIVANFKFPAGCKERFSYALLPAVPRVGDFVQSYRPQSGRYKVKAITFEVEDDTAEPKASLLIELDALDEVSAI